MAVAAVVAESLAQAKDAAEQIAVDYEELDAVGTLAAAPKGPMIWDGAPDNMAFDWGETYFYGVPDSGQTLPGHLLSASSSGPAWLSGGSVGPEGSVLCTLLILAVWLICATWLREIKYLSSLALQDSPALNQ